MLVKEPHNNAATEFHQDRPYWPHADDRHPLSAWIALVDVPPERGCMTFLPGTQHRTGLRPQDLHQEEDLFAADPSLRWLPRVTLPCAPATAPSTAATPATWRCPTAPIRPGWRMSPSTWTQATTYSGTSHVVTDPLGLTAGDRLDGDTFPALGLTTAARLACSDTWVMTVRRGWPAAVRLSW